MHKVMALARRSADWRVNLELALFSEPSHLSGEIFPGRNRVIISCMDEEHRSGGVADCSQIGHRSVEFNRIPGTSGLHVLEKAFVY